MATVEETFALAIQQHQASNWPQAEYLYRQVLQANPHHADAHHLLGILAFQASQFEQAVLSIRQAIALNPAAAAYHYNLGNALERQGQLSEAIASLRQALQLKPVYPEAYLNLGNTLKRQGQLVEAIRAYRQALGINPHFAQAHNNLGIALREQGRQQEAVTCFQQAVLINPNYAEAHNNLGMALRDHGRLAEAVACWYQALRTNPHFAEACNNLAHALMDQGQLDQAVQYYQQVLRLNPHSAPAHNNLGNALRAQGRLEEAEACYRQALRIDPHFAEAHSNLGISLRDQDRLPEAVASFQQALAFQPDLAGVHSNLADAQRLLGQLDSAVASCRHALRIDPHFALAHNNLGNALLDQGRLDEATASFQQALQINPNFAAAHSNLGNALREQGRLKEAVASFHLALRLDPNFADAHLNLANALMDLSRLDEATACCRQAARIKPRWASAHLNLANALTEQGKLDEAVACYRQALALEPDSQAALGGLVHQLQHLCLWDDLMVLSQRLIEVVARPVPRANANPVSPFGFLMLPTPTTGQEQLRVARQWVDVRTRSALPVGGKWDLPRPARADSKIRLGYLSSDFHDHATAYLMVELLEKHARDRFTVFGYSTGRPDGGAMRRRLGKACDQFVDLKDLNFGDAARRIEADSIDILVDLKGHTQHARTQILALRPAPIQVNYLGYPGTMGSSFIDFILIDDFVVPPEQQPFFTEKLVHLPDCYQVNDSQRQISDQTPTKSACGLPEQGFVFCCFNNSFKITPAVFTVWMDLLKAVPGSVLWLLEGNPYVAANLQKEAGARGVAAERLVFARRLPLADHLARHRLADLFLDTAPVNAHTTASDALWAGCPVLTLAQETFVSRVAGSLLRTLGLNELITTSLEEYQAMALRLAKDADLLRDLRARLAANREKSPLFEAEQFARAVERAYTTMWDIYTAGQQPRSFAVTAGKLFSL